MTVPETLGPVRLLELLGEGASGAVYRGEMIADRPYAQIGDIVAIKVLKPQARSRKSDLERFVREAELGKAVEHPCVVRTFEAGQDRQDGKSFPFTVMEYAPFIVMEFVAGRTLQRVMVQLGVIPEALLRALTVQFAGALDAVHRLGAVHRDLKPTNILITPDYQVKLSDLGIAYLTSEDTRLTGEANFVGTLTYAAPEQILGRLITPAVDLYSLGVVLYEAATGTQPFDADGPQAVIHKHLHDPVTPVSEINPDLTRFFEAVIGCLLEKSPENRFTTANQLLQVLEEGESSPWWTDRQRRPDPRPRKKVRVRRNLRFAGRDQELGKLRSLYSEVQSGHGQLVLIEGEAGVGKSRLLDEFLTGLDLSDEPRHVLYGSSAPGSGHGSALSRSILELFGEFDLEERLYEYLSGVRRLVPGFVSLLTGLPAPPGSDPLPKDALPPLFAHLVRGMATEGAIVWIFEDLHFASADDRSLFLTLAGIAETSSLMLIATTRSGTQTDDLAAMDQIHHLTRLALGRLSEGELVEILNDAVDLGPEKRRLLRRIVTKADGNPFFLAELVRELKENPPWAASVQEDVTDAPTVVAGSAPVSQIGIPETLRELLKTRVDALATEDRTLLNIAAVQGFVFDPALIASVRDLNLLEVLERLSDMERRAGIVKATGTGFEFNHHLMQEVIYDLIPPVLRRAYHGQLAEKFRDGRAANAGETTGDDAVFLAEHFLRGNRAQDVRETILTGLDHLASQYESEKLLELVDLALEAFGEDHVELRCDVRFRQADCLYFLGRREEERGVAVEALALAETSKDHARAARARWIEGRTSMGAGLEGVPVLEDAIDRARLAGARDIEASVLGTLGQTYLFVGQFERSQELFRRQAAISQELGDEAGEADAEYFTGESYLGLRGFEEARDHLAASVKSFRKLGLARQEARALADLATAHFTLGVFDRARVAFDRSLELSRELGYLEGESIALGNFVGLAAAEGDLEEVEALLAAWQECNRTIRYPFFEAYIRWWKSQLAWVRGDLEKAKTACAASVEQLKELQAIFAVSESLLRLGNINMDLGDTKAARENFAESAECAAQMGMVDPAPLPTIYLGQLDGADLSELEIPMQMRATLKAEGYLELYRAGAGDGNLQKAKELLEAMSAHLSGHRLMNFWKYNPTARAVAGLSTR